MRNTHAGDANDSKDECIERRILFSRKVDLSELGNQTTELSSSVSAQPTLESADDTISDGMKPRAAGGGARTKRVNGHMSRHQRSRSSDSGAGVEPPSPSTSSTTLEGDAHMNEATSTGTNVIENVLLLHMADGCTYTVDTDIVAQKKRRRKKSLSLGNERRRSSSGGVYVEPVGKDDGNGGVEESDSRTSAGETSTDDPTRARSRPPSRDGKASVATIDEEGIGADFSDDEQTTLGALSQRQSPSSFISYDKESYEDVSRSMSVGWAGGSLLFDDGNDGDRSGSSSSSSSSSMRRGGSRRSKSVDFNGVRVFGDQDELNGGGMYTNVRMKRRSSSNADTTVGAADSLRDNKGEAGREVDTSGRRRESVGTSGGESGAERITLDAFKNDATMTVNARSRLREALVRRDASSMMLERFIMRPKYVASGSDSLVGRVGSSGRDCENTSFDVNSWKAVAEEKRRELRDARALLASRRDGLKLRSDLLIKGLRGIGFARSRLDAAQNMLISGGQLRRRSSSNGASGDADETALQGVPRLRMLEKKLCTRRHILVRELSRIYTISGNLPSPSSMPLQPTPPIGAEKLAKANAVLLMCGVSLGKYGGVDISRRKNIDRAESEALGAALGYVAQAVHVIASYLDIPLRYNIRLFASRSVVVDLAPPLRLVGPANNGSNGTETSQMSHRSSVSRRGSLGYDRQIDVDGSGGGSSPISPSARAPPRPMSYPSVALPLYIENMYQSNEFHAAVWLLNKDIEQLLSACGETTAGSKLHNTLENLRRLFEAVQNAPVRRVLM